MTLEMEEIERAGYEKIYKVQDKSCGLMGIIAVHNTELGHALGGVRAVPYHSFDDALVDAMRLSQGMTRKAALADLSLGGGKGVIMLEPGSTLSEAQILSFGRAVDSLGGLYYAAEDSGTTTAHMAVMNRVTNYLVGMEKEGSSGDPGLFTAWGTIRGMQATIEQITGSDSLEGKVIAVQGLGAVGRAICEHLFWLGAELVVTDISAERVKNACQYFGARAVEPEAIYDVECDIFAPCALGAILNARTIPRLKCLAVAGCANNQLETAKDGVDLDEKGILFAPDYIINGGGLINVYDEFEEDGYSPTRVRARVSRIYDRILEIYDLAATAGLTPDQAAERLAAEVLESKRSQKGNQIYEKTGLLVTI